MNYFGQISVTKLCDWARKHPECVKEVRFRDGRTEKMLNIEVLERREPSQWGDVGYIRVKAADGEKAYVADLKKKQVREQPASSGECVDADAEGCGIPESGGAERGCARVAAFLWRRGDRRW